MEETAGHDNGWPAHLRMRRFSVIFLFPLLFFGQHEPPGTVFNWEQRRSVLLQTQNGSPELWIETDRNILRLRPPHTFAMQAASDWVGHHINLREAEALIASEIQFEEERPEPVISDPPKLGELIHQAHFSTRLFEPLCLLAAAQIELREFGAAHATLGRIEQFLDGDFKRFFDEDSFGGVPEYRSKYEALAAELGRAEGKTVESGARGASFAPWVKLNFPLPDLAVPGVDGRVWTRADFQNKATLIYLWATWCGPCWAELPVIQMIQDTVKGRDDLQVVALSVDEDVDPVKAFLKEKGYTFPVMVSKPFAESLAPYMKIGDKWIVDRAGAVRLERFGASRPGQKQAAVDEAIYKMTQVFKMAAAAE